MEGIGPASPCYARPCLLTKEGYPSELRMGVRREEVRIGEGGEGATGVGMKKSLNKKR